MHSALHFNTKYSIVNIILNVPHDVDERLQLCYLCRTETDPQPQTSLVNQVFPLSHLNFFLNFFQFSINYREKKIGFTIVTLWFEKKCLSEES